uniref:hypothetical protein n=1 Tax=Neisseria sicca TaxID=490 RepID=UPI001C994915
MFLRGVSDVLYVDGGELVKVEFVGSSGDVEGELGDRGGFECEGVGGWVGEIGWFKFEMGGGVWKGGLIDGDGVEGE